MLSTLAELAAMKVKKWILFAVLLATLSRPSDLSYIACRHDESKQTKCLSTDQGHTCGQGFTQLGNSSFAFYLSCQMFIGSTIKYAFCQNYATLTIRCQPFFDKVDCGYGFKPVNVSEIYSSLSDCEESIAAKSQYFVRCRGRISTDQFCHSSIGKVRKCPDDSELAGPVIYHSLDDCMSPAREVPQRWGGQFALCKDGRDNHFCFRNPTRFECGKGFTRQRHSAFETMDNCWRASELLSTDTVPDEYDKCSSALHSISYCIPQGLGCHLKDKLIDKFESSQDCCGDIGCQAPDIK